MNELEIINLVKEWAYRTDYNNGMKGYELSEQELKHVAETIVKKFAICGVGSSLPKVCKGCGSLSTKVIDKKYLACCPDSNYIPMENYCKNSIYPEEQF